METLRPLPRHALILAIAGCLVLAGPSATPAFAQTACDPANGIGPDGGLPALPPPVEPGATYVDLAPAAAPVDMVLHAGTGRLYVVERGANDVVVIDARAEVPTIVGSVKVGDRPTAMALDEASQRLHVANGAACSISVIDVATSSPQVLATLHAGSGPRGLAVDPASGQVWTANWTGEAITPIDGRAASPALADDPVLVGPGHVGAAVDDSVARVILISDAGLEALEPTTGQPAGATVVPPGSYDVTTDRAGTAFIVHASSGQVTRVDLTGETPVVTATSGSIASEPFDVRFEPSLDRVLVPSRNGEVLFLDPATIEVLERVPSSPTVAATVFDEVTGRLWMLDYTYHRVWSLPLEGIVAGVEP